MTHLPVSRLFSVSEYAISGRMQSEVWAGGASHADLLPPFAREAGEDRRDRPSEGRPIAPGEGDGQTSSRSKGALRTPHPAGFARHLLPQAGEEVAAQPSTKIPPRRQRALRLDGFERQARRRLRLVEPRGLSEAVP